MDDRDFLSSMEKQQDIQRTQLLYDEAAKKLSVAASTLNSFQLDATVGRTAYFEKLTIGAGATIAAMVSFLGTDHHRLNPEWLMRGSLICLVVVIFTALFRNYRYPFYMLTVRQIEYLQASRERASVSGIFLEQIQIHTISKPEKRLMSSNGLLTLTSPFQSATAR